MWVKPGVECKHHIKMPRNQWTHHAFEVCSSGGQKKVSSWWPCASNLHDHSLNHLHSQICGCQVAPRRSTSSPSHCRKYSSLAVADLCLPFSATCPRKRTVVCRMARGQRQRNSCVEYIYIYMHHHASNYILHRPQKYLKATLLRA